MKQIIATLIMSVVTYIASAVTWETGTMTVVFRDTEGNPIKNGVLYVRVLNKVGWTIGGETDYKIYTANTDENGVATASFKFFHPHFMWRVEAPSHHCDGFGFRDETFSAKVVRSDYYNLDTTTPEGLARYNELKELDESGDHAAYLAKFEPKKVTYNNRSITRSVVFMPKNNPQPMCVYYGDNEDSMGLPFKDFDLGVALYPVMQKGVTIVTNESGVVTKEFIPVGFDMMYCRFLPPWGGRFEQRPGKKADFTIHRYLVNTNDIETMYGWIEFEPGCGAYKRKLTGDRYMKTEYEADPNEIYQSRFEFKYHRKDGRSWTEKSLLSTNEYFVCRTRVQMNSENIVTNCKYSVIIGGMRTSKRLSFRKMIFNPHSNDINIEPDDETNLAKDIWRNSGIDQW